MKNRIAILEKLQRMRINQADVPVPKKDEVLINVEYVGLCGSDIHAFEYGPYIPPKDPNMEIGLGHECAGTVVAIGDSVTSFKVGDKVAVEPGVPCGVCSYCQEGRYNICPDVDFMATSPNYKGALTNYMTHPEARTFLLPDHMDTLEGALVEPMAVGFHAVKKAGATGGKKVVILGAGCIGLMTLQACKTKGVTDIVVVDLYDNKLELAKELGASAVINASKHDVEAMCKDILGEDGADIVFETAGSQKTASQTTSLVMRGGTIAIVGTIKGETPINFLQINREVTIMTVFRYANAYPETIQAIASGQVDVKKMVNRMFTFDEVQEAFDYAITHKKELIKGVVQIAT
ncbi:NAD(P)-dependent alcohol dehydrogenase [Priestia endophytica]|uniref:NAD(P)-dependent alcohol dehydrogenase n=1 Tax=Priestia endophytica TaxID=135735 RepID=UPI000DCA62E3|nr:NAD(P)-dependent alcohol dehydrogenase [Priestia endophytica]RAS75618.1 alcohol dehydrogenase [Priestia endophytica]